MGDGGTTREVLLAGLPLRHLEAAARACCARGSVVLPAGGPGDLDAAAAGTDVLLMPDAGEAACPPSPGAPRSSGVPHRPDEA